MNQAQAEFWKKCKEDVVFFATASYDDHPLVWIKHVSKGRIPLGRYIHAWQREMLTDLQAGRSIIAEKSRRVGFSWTCCVFATWLIEFHPDPECLFLSVNQLKAKNLLRKLKFVDRNLPSWIRREIGVDSAERYSLVKRNEEGVVTSEAVVDSLTTTGSSGRGEGARFVLCDELAWMDNGEEVLAAVIPTTADGGLLAIGSTHNGTGSSFYRVLEDAKREYGEVKPYSIHWKRECGYSDEWFRKASKGMTPAQIGQEFELEPMISGTPAFNPIDVRACYMPPDQYPDVQKMIDESQRFFSAIDSAEGKTHGKKGSLLPDYNACCVLNEKGVQVHAEHNRDPLTKWAGETMNEEDGSQINVKGRVSEIHAEFPGQMAVEKNAQGLVVINRHELPDDNISELLQKQMTSQFKNRIIVQLEHAIASHQVVITDYFTYQQLLVYQRVSSSISGMLRYEAPAGAYDDAVITLSIAYDLALHSGIYDFDWFEAFSSGSRVSMKPPAEREALMMEVPTVISIPEEQASSGFALPRLQRGIDPWQRQR